MVKKLTPLRKYKYLLVWLDGRTEKREYSNQKNVIKRRQEYLNRTGHVTHLHIALSGQVFLR